ncbi:similar to Hsc70 cochaperone SGT [Rhizoctonia solani AG-1 IB]|uniref:Similar to Hsc70 cochaperone SGT n=1 Tax=Thanatephorus cucumeris (strain AG1-IB / isolate 7/3/14) TaxID=1108050 RepID=M5BVW3_THACB|nr:similar to Hsc70 cochaperone SGT [Rhizoctonia solani AG-1 IB]
MADKKQKLVLSIIEFLETSVTDGSIKSDDKEGIEVAIQCIGEAFGVDPSNTEQKEKLSIKPATLQSLFDVYLKTKDKVGAQVSFSLCPIDLPDNLGYQGYWDNRNPRCVNSFGTLCGR